MQNLPANEAGRWDTLSQTQAWKTWSGYAFENVCLQHIDRIKQALSIMGVHTRQYSFWAKGDDENEGTQIDLIIDRADNCMNLLEVKFYNDEYEVTSSYAQQLRKKMGIFKRATRTKKNIFITMLSVFGVKKNAHYLGIVTNQLLIDDLFT